MRELPPRTYSPDAPIRKRLLPNGISHPAKMHLELCRDLFLRYTLPGQTVLDPFGGVGGSLIGCTLGRNVIGVELEPPFVEHAKANYARLRNHTLPGVPLGEATILQGDSRKLPLPSAECDVVCSSPPYAEALSGQGGRQRAVVAGDTEYDHRRGYGLDAQQGGLSGIGYSTSTDNIGNLPHGDVDSVLTSPPFGAMNATTAGGNVGKMRPAKDGRGYEGEDRHNWVYSEETPGQIGNMPHAAITSPPYVDARGDWPTPEGAENIRYGDTAGQIGGLKHGDVDAILSSPPYADVASRDRATEPNQEKAIERFGNRYGHGDPSRHIDGYGHSEGQIGALPHAVLTSPPYADANPQGNTNGEKGIHSDEGMTRLKKDYVRFEHADSISKQDGEDYASACLQVYRECYRVVRPGGVLVLVTGNYVRNGTVIDLAADTIKLAVAAGWTPLERWRHEKAQVSFWRRLHHKQGRPVVTHEDVLVFVKQYQGWQFNELEPTYTPPAALGLCAEGVEAVLEDARQAVLPLELEVAG